MFRPENIVFATDAATAQANTEPNRENIDVKLTSEFTLPAGAVVAEVLEIAATDQATAEVKVYTRYNGFNCTITLKTLDGRTNKSLHFGFRTEAEMMNTVTRLSNTEFADITAVLATIQLEGTQTSIDS